jgi:hypothetical protein
MPQKFSYKNTQSCVVGGKKTVRNVTIKNGKGYKKISEYYRGKHKRTSKKPLKNEEMQMIQIGKFIPGLFNDCKNCKKN